MNAIRLDTGRFPRPLFVLKGTYMKKAVFLFLSAALTGVLAQADPANLAHCDGADQTGSPIHVTIHQDVGGQLVALYTMEAEGGGLPTFPYTVEYQPPAAGDLGAGLTFEGEILSLSINTDGPGNPFKGRLTVKDMNVYDREVDCSYAQRPE